MRELGSGRTVGNNPVVHPLRGIYVARPGLEFHFTATGPSLPPGDFFAVQKSVDTAQFWETPFNVQPAQHSIQTAVDSLMFGGVDTVAEMTKLSTQFLPPQVANGYLSSANSRHWHHASAEGDSVSRRRSAFACEEIDKI